MEIFTGFYHDPLKQTLVLVISHHLMAPKIIEQRMEVVKTARAIKRHKVDPKDTTDINCAEDIVRDVIAEAVANLSETTQLTRVIIVSECNLAFPGNSVGSVKFFL